MTTTRLATVRVRVLSLATLLAFMLLGCTALASGAQAAATSAPAWTAALTSQPTNFAPGSTNAADGDSYVLTATNTGGAPTTGAVTISDTLPAAITPHNGSGIDDSIASFGNGNTIDCTRSGQTVRCTDETDAAAIQPGEQIVITIPVDVASSAPPSVTNSATVTGGGAPDANATTQTAISGSPAPFGLLAFSAQSLNSDGTTDTQAGDHPDSVETGFAVSTIDSPSGEPIPGGNLRSTSVVLPAGLIGNPQTAPKCTQNSLDLGINQPPQNGPVAGCAADTQVGVADVSTAQFAGAAENTVMVPIYNVQPPSGVPAQFAFQVLSSTIHISFSARTGGDYGLNATIDGINTSAPVYATTVILWGDPADSSHDADRFLPANRDDGPGDASGNPLPSDSPKTGFISNPTACGGPLTTSIDSTTWQAPSTTVSASAVSPAVTGCAAVPFTPTVSLAPDTASADSPSGLNVDIHVPQNDDPNSLAEANLQNVAVKLPAGMAVSPSGATGLQGCTAAQIGLDNAAQPTCPNAAKLGSVEIDTPLLTDPLVGSVYIAQQTANPFGSLLALYVTAQADGVLVKLAGQVTPDPTTGQLTATFEDNPQLPFSDFKLDFFGGPQAALVTPSQCGTYTAYTSLSSYAAPSTPAMAANSFTINSGCAIGFGPGFTAGTTSAQAGAYSPLVLSFARADTDQTLSGLSLKLPDGMLAKLAGVQECSTAQLDSISSLPGSGAAQAADPTCPAGSQVGTVQVQSGPGTAPYQLGGHAYLTGPYEGAPYGLAVVVPALAGPFDLGTVVVRQALYINPTSAQVSVHSDPFPTILDGIPLNIRAITVDLSRPDFTVNPTRCTAGSIRGTLESSAGTMARISSRYQATGCSKLKFSPKLALTLSGRHRTATNSHPKLSANLTQGSGQTNVRAVTVTLPLSMALDPDNSQHVCSVPNADKIRCSKSTIVGHAVARTRLLPHPLFGKVFLVQGLRKDKKGNTIRTLPHLLVPLRGKDKVAINLRGKTAVDGRSRLVTTFGSVPDAAIKSFDLTINGGKKGILVVTGNRNLCRGAQVGLVRESGQNGKRHSSSLKVATPACPASGSKKSGSKKSGS